VARATVNGLSLSLSERHGFQLSPTSYRPDRIRGLCDRSCRKCSKSCRQPRCSCGRCGPSCCSCSNSALRSGQNHCHLPGSCVPYDQSCCNCNSSIPVPVEKHRHASHLTLLLHDGAVVFSNSSMRIGSPDKQNRTWHTNLLTVFCNVSNAIATVAKILIFLALTCEVSKLIAFEALLSTTSKATVPITSTISSATTSSLWALPCKVAHAVTFVTCARTHFL